MTTIDLDTLDELEPDAGNDFRRASKGVPLIKNEASGKYERYRRSSSVGKILDDETGLTDWKVRTIVEGAAQRPDLMALVSTFDHEANKREIRDLAEQCLVQGKGTQRRETGTAVHAMLDHIDRGDEWTPAPQFIGACNAYVETRDAFGLVPVDIECKCVNDVWRLAGTADRRYQTTRVLIAPDGTIIPIGSILIGDTKTGRTLEYAHGVYATQLAGYADSVRYDPLTDERTPFDPPTNRDWALVVHVGWEDGTCAMHWVDLEAGRAGIALALDVYAWRRRTDMITPARPPLRIVPSEPPAPTVPDDPITPSNGPTEAGFVAVPDISAHVGHGHTSPDVLALVREWLRERVAAIVAHGDGPTFMLQGVWPDGVAGLKHEGHTEAQLDAIAHAITLVESEWSMSWAVRDPRAVASDAWANGRTSATNTERDALAQSVANHPRKALLEKWSVIGKAGLDPTITDRLAITHALYEFALVNDDWSDEDVTEMLDGTLRAIGYENGIDALGKVIPEHAPHVMSAAFALVSGSAVLLYREDGKPVVRTPQSLNP